MDYQRKQLQTVEYEPVDYENTLNDAIPGNGLHKTGFVWPRLFGDTHPYDDIEWERRTAKITKGDGTVVFEQTNIEVPSFWTQTATDIVASKYFRGQLNTLDREYSAKQMVDRVADTMTKWGLKDGYFASPEDAENFSLDLKWILINQYAAFNSPVWFNVGVHEHPQSSACFILSVEDNMQSILDWYRDEGWIFKGGSGAGTNLSKLRSSKEPLSKGGYSSGPVSFMKGADGVANSIRSGGTTRRAAKMVVLNIDHPDIKNFIYCKKIIEDMTKALAQSGIKDSIEADIFDPYTLLPYQNANNSVRVADEFMKAVENDSLWNLKAVTSGETIERLRAKELMDWIADAAWHSADPGIQYDTTINDWHTLTNTGRINASNPCVTGDTLVATKEGLRRIRDLVGKNPEVGTSKGYKKASKVWQTGVKETFKLMTKSGYSVKVTKDHKFYIRGKGYIEVCNLKRGDKIPLIGSDFGYEALKNSLAFAIGYAVGDGCISHKIVRGNSALTWVGGEEDYQTLGRIANYINVASSDMKIGFGGGLVNVHHSTPGWKVVTSKKSIVEMISSYAVLDQESVNKKFTDKIFSLDQYSITSLLRGVFTADGTVSGNKKKGYYVGLDSTSTELLEQVQVLLLNFGIKSKIYRNRRTKLISYLPDSRRELKAYPVLQMHSLRITRSSRVKFEKEIGFDESSPKYSKLYLINKSNESYLDLMEDEFVDLVPNGIEPVYDLTEPVTHQFIANGLLVHNCSEYMSIDNSACNLASLNLLKFMKEDSKFDVDLFRKAVDTLIMAMDIIVDNSSYPTERITQNAKDYRQLGLGYANLGSLLMVMGLPYDSEKGRAVAGQLTSLMCGEAYRMSALIADIKGPFNGYSLNKEPMLGVIEKHIEEAEKLYRKSVKLDTNDEDLLNYSRIVWNDALNLGRKYGIRNSQATVLAPTGCLVGDSLVLTDRGLVRLQSLGNPDGEKWQSLNIKVATNEGPQQSTKFFINGVEPVVTVETHRGYKIKGTTTHRIRIVDNNGNWQWRRLVDLKKSDHVPLMMGGMIGEAHDVPLPPLPEAYWTSDYNTFVPRSMNSDLAEIVGYFMGDGSLHSRGLRFCVTNGDYDVIERLVNLGHKLFGLEAKITLKQGYTEVALHSVRLTLWWEACGFTKRPPIANHRGKGYESHIPDSILYSNDSKVYQAFIRGLFEADGTASNGYVAWSTISERFSRDIQTLLLTLGFVTTHKIDKSNLGKWGRNPSHVIRLLNWNIGARFLKEISFISNRKREALAVGDHPQAARYDLIPVDRAMIDILAPDNNNLRKTMLLALSRHSMVTRRSAVALYEQTHDPGLARTLDYFYDEVEHVKLGEEEMTYDISVPSNVTYVANGFIGHNTIAFLMDCDTTGVEPELALVKYKKLVGGGTLKLVNNQVSRALQKLGYSEEQITDISNYIIEKETIEGAPHLLEDDLPVFDCSFRALNGQRSINYMGHIKMMAAAQPFISGAISKTVNLPSDATREDIKDVFIQGWKLGLKAIAVYRDGCKSIQPLNMTNDQRLTTDDKKLVERVNGYMRIKLPDERPSITHKFSVGGYESYLTIGFYPETHKPGETFLTTAKEGSTVSGLLNTVATLISIALQSGVPLKTLVRKFKDVRFEPAGFTNNADIPTAKSIIDYVFRYMGMKYLSDEEREEIFGPNPANYSNGSSDHNKEAILVSMSKKDQEIFETAASSANPYFAENLGEASAPACVNCGSLMIRAGSCYSCPNCFTTTGVCN